MSQKRYIVMLENDEHDKELSAGYFKASHIPCEFINFSNDVIPFLMPKQKSNHLPDLILLSMNSLPHTGLSVLKELKAIEELKHIPVIILGENTQKELIRECYANGVSTFINKPFTDALTDRSIKSFIHYWFEVAQLPEQQNMYAV